MIFLRIALESARVVRFGSTASASARQRRKEKESKISTRTGGRIVHSHNLSRTACHSYPGTRREMKACHHTPTDLRNEIHVHGASHLMSLCSRFAGSPLTFESKWRRQSRTANQTQNALRPPTFQRKVFRHQNCDRCREISPRGSPPTSHAGQNSHSW